MVQIKTITADELQEVVSKTGFDRDLILKDYYLTVILYLLKDVEGIYFKGGTALQKIFLNYARLSEDIDYTVVGDIEKIKEQITREVMNSKIFKKVGKDKDVDRFTRLLVYYTDFNNQEQMLFIDLNKRAKLTVPPEVHVIKHFYKEFLPEFSCSTVAKEEIIAEKVAATIGRNMPRDHFDVYKILENKEQINMALVKQKCEESGNEFSIIKMFNKAQKLHKRWNEDLAPLLSEEVSFKQVIKTLATVFNLKNEKDAIKKTKQEKKQ